MGLLIILSVRKGVSGIKLMLLGITITLIGVIIAIDSNSNLGDIKYLITIMGLIFSIVGLGKKIKEWDQGEVSPGTLSAKLNAT